jgi:hypothetical protein
MTPIQDHSIYIKHKIINGQPFLEVTVFNGANTPLFARAVDQTTFSPAEKDTMQKVIERWMYEKD